MLISKTCELTSSENQGQSVGSGEKEGRMFSSTGERAPGYRLSPNYFKKFKRMPAPDWAQKMLCIIVPNRRTVSPQFFSWVRTRRLLFQSRLVWLMHQRNTCSQETFILIFGTQGLFSPYFKTFVAPFLSTRLTAPGSPGWLLFTIKLFFLLLLFVCSEVRLFSKFNTREIKWK